jgi:hypothetical protein
VTAKDKVEQAVARYGLFSCRLTLFSPEAYWYLADIRSLANAALRFKLRVPGKLCGSSAESGIRCDHEMSALHWLAALSGF